MWLRYGLVLLVSTSYTSCSSDDDIASWVLSLQKQRREEKEEPAIQKLDLTPTYLKAGKAKLDLTPTYIETTIDCLLKDGRRGQCVPYFQCDDKRNIIEDGSSLIDFRAKGKCPSKLEVCCGYKRSATDEDDANVNDVDDENKMFLSENISVDDVSDKCGWTNLQSTSADNSKKVRDPEKAIFDEFRWMVALIKKRAGVSAWVSNDYIGGGSLIHPSVVLTAAHKLSKDVTASQLKCRAGELNVQTTSEAYQFQERDASKNVIHPDFFQDSFYYDAALIFLKEPFNLESAPHIGLACLNTLLPPPATECYTMGWGLLPKEKIYATQLKKIKVPLVAADVCANNLRSTQLGRFYRVHSSLTCAGGQEGADSCEKDGGSSLVCPIQTNGDNVRYAVVGMVAYGVDCGKKDRPGVYVKVPAVTAWIDKVMTDEKYGTVTYTI